MDRRLLSIGLVLVFLGYAYHQQQENNQAVNQVIPNTNSPSTTPTPAATSSNPSALPTTVSPGSAKSSQSAPSSSPSTKSTTTSQYKNGTYTGSVADAFYGNVQVSVTVSGGKITAVTFLQHPSDRQTSMMINNQAMPMLSQQAIQAQSANVDGVSGASATSQAFVQSLSSALAKAKA